jgi:two-component system nitrogen regulation sensor histidine kinase NtrY
MSSETTLAPASGFLAGFMDWTRRAQLERKLAFVFVVLGVLSGSATFVVITGDLPIAGEPETLLLLLTADLVLMLGLSALVARRLALIWIQRRRGLAGARLHGRLVALFSVVAVTPTIVVAVFSVMLFDLGLRAWFSERVSTAVHNSLAVAEAYTQEHLRTISNDALAISQVINRRGAALIYNPLLLGQVLSQQSHVRSLTEAAVYDGSGQLLGRATDFLLAFNPDLPDWAFEEARAGKVAIIGAEGGDHVRALIRLDLPADTFLFVGRLVDPRVVGHMDRTRGAVQLYSDIEGKRFGMEITFALIFVMVAILLLLAAVWVGLGIANHLTAPIGALIEASEQVAAGDLGARVATRGSGDEIDSLSHAFNRMTGELQTQQGELIKANRLLDSGKEFIEAVLRGVSAGVLGLDPKGHINVANRVACELLGMSAEELRTKHLSEVMPDIEPLLDQARRRPRRLFEQGTVYQRGADRALRLLVRVAIEENREGVFGFVVTLDDITELEAAQRKAAWSDVARRIAHEIKNPLTPIQLSAERLRRKYLSQIESEPETFKTCTDTIIRHVEDIGRMVDEFSAFARMPAPVFEEECLQELIEQTVFLQRTAETGISYDLDLPDDPIRVPCDRQQISRALTNLLLNAAEAIKARRAAEGPESEKGHIVVRLSREDRTPVIEVVDNGRGLPVRERDRLTEPYVTTRESGTGLGLAIVKKIVEDHDGDLHLLDNPEGGAIVRIRLMRDVAADSAQADAKVM